MTALPLFESGLLQVRGSQRSRPSLVNIRRTAAPLIPDRAPLPGEQYRFHFDMTKCIGCKCCVVACNEQNGNPASINWRRVGEIEGGHYPHTQRHYLSMGCNQCLDPSCMTGCPVKAYHKDHRTGVVVHDADTCIGCQYCTWNCSYGVPQYNPERGVVGKCDLCHNRLAEGAAPACVAACPEEAIAIEIVDVEAWRQNYLEANAPGMPAAGDSISTTRVTVPENLTPGIGRVDTQMIEPEDPHWPLVFMLVLTQLAAGALSTICLLDAFGVASGLWRSALASLGVAAVSLCASTLHLGRPIHALRALRGLRHSWLSREVLSLSLFAVIASLFAVALLLHWPHRNWIGLLTAGCAAAGVTCSARLYMVSARPVWFSTYTVAEFFSTAILLGPLFVRAIGVSEAHWITWIGVGGAATQLLTQALKFLWLSRSEPFELRASAMLLSGRFQRHFLLRLGTLVAVSIALSAGSSSGWVKAGVLALALGGELLGRWLFFVSVVPKGMAAAFPFRRRAA